MEVKEEEIFIFSSFNLLPFSFLFLFFYFFQMETFAWKHFIDVTNLLLFFLFIVGIFFFYSSSCDITINVSSNHIFLYSSSSSSPFCTLSHFYFYFYNIHVHIFTNVFVEKCVGKMDFVQLWYITYWFRFSINIIEWSNREVSWRRLLELYMDIKPDMSTNINTYI